MLLSLLVWLCSTKGDVVILVMKLQSEKEISMVVILLIAFTILSILSVTNKIILNRRIRKELRISDDLHTIFQQFCEREVVDPLKLSNQRLIGIAR